MKGMMMSRNLIDAKAWEGGRRDICRKCRHFAVSDSPQRYEWQNCRRADSQRGYGSLWEAGKCRGFEAKAAVQNGASRATKAP